MALEILGTKILGKYEILEQIGQDVFRARTATSESYREFEIQRILQDTGGGGGELSYKAQTLSSLSHKNLSNLLFDEDGKYFYFIRRLHNDTKPLDSSIFKQYDDKVRYQKLLECYLQILEAIKYIHHKGFYHGNINPNNILIDHDNHVYLLDFGASYFYEFVTRDKRFYAPEQLGFGDKMANSDIRSDIYAFGICMLKILLDSGDFEFSFNSLYNDPRDLDSIFKPITEDYDLESVENELFILITKMCLFEADSRISLEELERELKALYKSVCPRFSFEIHCHSKTVEIYCENNYIDQEEFREHIQERIELHNAYIQQYYDEARDENKLEIALSDLIFECSAEQNNDEYLFCYKIIENQDRRAELIRERGIEFKHDFVITTKGYYHPDRTDIAYFKEVWHRDFEAKQILKQRHKLDKQSIESEEKLLEAEKLTIEQKKNTKIAKFKGIKRGADEISFQIIEPKKDDEDQEDRESNLANEQIDFKPQEIVSIHNQRKNNTINAEVRSFNPNTSTLVVATEYIKEFRKRDKITINRTIKAEITALNLQEEKLTLKIGNTREFKTKDKVVIQNENEDSIKAEVVSFRQDTNKLIVKMEKYDTNEIEAFFEEGKDDKLPTFRISYDYQVEEILWSKRNAALESLKNGNVLIPNLISKINEPKTLKENERVEIPSFFNQDLDENQKEAVIKAMGLEVDSELLLIQGPPGTGKTTTITEMVQQILKRHKHYKILISSQSNQAVDNVLEKLSITEDKILRIGNDTSKMSKEAQKFTPEKVLNKIIAENIKRIDSNPISDEDKSVETGLRALQQDFKKRLQSISSKMAKKRGNKKTKESDLANLFLKNRRLIFGTLLGISSWEDFRQMVFDIAIVDEAGRATLSELLVPCIKVRRLVLVGDHKQLAPVIDDEVASNLEGVEKKEAGTSLFERLFERMKRDKEQKGYIEHFYHRLTYNYRAHKDICELYSQSFYEGELKTKEEISKDREHKLKSLNSSVVWLDTGKKSNKEDMQKGTGKINHCNVGVIEGALNLLFKEVDSQILQDIGIITPYKAQKELLENRLKALKGKGLRIDIGTVDSFQGSDRDIIIYDCVRSSKAKNIKGKKGGSKIDFIADEKRLNVSLSRAKKLLIIVGDMEYLYTSNVSEGENPFILIIDFMKKNLDKYQIITLSEGV